MVQKMTWISPTALQWTTHKCDWQDEHRGRRPLSTIAPVICLVALRSPKAETSIEKFTCINGVRQSPKSWRVVLHQWFSTLMTATKVSIWLTAIIVLTKKKMLTFPDDLNMLYIVHTTSYAYSFLPTHVFDILFFFLHFSQNGTRGETIRSFD
jgi:hypothetical protein